MSKMIFVNLPVADLPKSMAFYEAIGFTNNPQFTDETAACMVLTDTIYVMLLTHGKFAQFTTREIADSHRTAQMLLALSCDSREGVDRITAAALGAGGSLAHDVEDLGFMYSTGFFDPDGHGWGPFFMDMASFEAQQAAPAPEPTAA
ncbi:MAG TPA: VOC family protein [Allosphingosinicella sp.]|nr:VOC family protein [Allosphingosinicella sp.]